MLFVYKFMLKLVWKLTEPIFTVLGEQLRVVRAFKFISGNLFNF